MNRIRYMEFQHQLFSNALMGDKDLYWVTINLDAQNYFIVNSQERCVAKGKGESRTDLLKLVRSELKAFGVNLDAAIVQRKRR